MSYVDGFVLPVPTKNLAKYRRIARLAAKIWREHGALAYVECLGDAMHGQPGHPFPKLLKLKPTESVVFGWGLFRSLKHRDQVNARVIKDKRLAKLDLPFDIKRMTYGGFKVLAESEARCRQGTREQFGTSKNSGETRPAPPRSLGVRPWPLQPRARGLEGT